MGNSSPIPSLRHREYRDWLSQIDFFQDEIRIFQNELMAVLHRHPDYMSIIEHVDEYRRILMRKLQHLDDFRRQIVLQERQLALPLLSGREGQAEGSEESEELAEQFQQFVHDYDTFKKSFRRFVAHHN